MATETTQPKTSFDGKPRMSQEEMYRLIRTGDADDFNRRRAAGESVDLSGVDLRNLDLREFDLTGVDLSNCYLRQADLRGQNLTTCRLDGASIHSARISGTYFPNCIPAEELRLSRECGTRIRYPAGA